jgi:hypothetical protein
VRLEIKYPEISKENLVVTLPYDLFSESLQQKATQSFSDPDVELAFTKFSARGPTETKMFTMFDFKNYFFITGFKRGNPLILTLKFKKLPSEIGNYNEFQLAFSLLFPKRTNSEKYHPYNMIALPQASEKREKKTKSSHQSSKTNKRLRKSY